MAYLFVRVSVEAEDVGDSLHEVERHAARASRIAQARRSPLRPRYLFVLSLLPCPLCARCPVVFLFDVVFCKQHSLYPVQKLNVLRKDRNGVQRISSFILVYFDIF